MSIENKTKKVIDDLGGAGTADKLEGKLHEVSGKAKEALGDIKDDPKLQAEGQAEEAEGKIQQAMGTVSAVAHGLVDAVADGAHKVSDAVKHMVHHEKEKE